MPSPFWSKNRAQQGGEGEFFPLNFTNDVLFLDKEILAQKHQNPI